MANNLQPLAELGAVEGAKLIPGAAGFMLYGVTLQTWALAIPVLYYLALLVDLVGRRWIFPLIKMLRARGKPCEGAVDDAD
ncbi:TPA: hypothetical protein ACYSGT_006182 [Pseudomonas aeruginosa]|uniref:Uncharacterized protein n=1 Tax=Aquipseudomonas alcaligenes TaxID=43263 RepID=A0A2V4L3Z9_AQUAC|nr:hypothetical protein [Pseudomonas alcaligenes]PYC19530.1 hypothetical protein DMO17_19325 [Pseudomonas alcaligenes]